MDWDELGRRRIFGEPKRFVARYAPAPMMVNPMIPKAGVRAPTPVSSTRHPTRTVKMPKAMCPDVGALCAHLIFEANFGCLVSPPRAGT